MVCDSPRKQPSIAALAATVIVAAAAGMTPAAAQQAFPAREPQAQPFPGQSFSGPSDPAPGIAPRPGFGQGRPAALTPREAANRLIVAARKRYNTGLAAPQPRVRLLALAEARQALLQIIDRHPTTDHAVALIGGDSVAGLSLPMVEEAIRATQTLIASQSGGANQDPAQAAPATTSSIPRASEPHMFDPDQAARLEWENRTGEPYPGSAPGAQPRRDTPATGMPPASRRGATVPNGPAQVSSVSCDQLAASPNDVTRTAPGVWHGAIDPTPAIDACAQAAALFPDEPRFAYQYARALYSANRFGEAFTLFQRAANAGHKTARAQVAMMTLAGLGTVGNQTAAIAALEAAAEDDNPFAMAILAELQMAGRGLPQDRLRGLALMRQAAEAGNPFAMQRMGQLLSSGTQTENKDREALAWMRRAASENSPEALYLLGVFHRDGRVVETDAAKALGFFQRAAERGHGGAAYQVGVAAYQRGGDEALREGLRWMEQAAENGEAASYYTLAYAYGFGHGTTRDPRKSAAFMFRSLESGSDTALTQMTQNPDQWPRDMRRALQIKLQEARIYRSSVDGNFGPATIKAIGELAKRAEQKTAASSEPATAE
jgi:TPR repeat protein